MSSRNLRLPSKPPIASKWDPKNSYLSEETHKKVKCSRRVVVLLMDGSWRFGYYRHIPVWGQHWWIEGTTGDWDNRVLRWSYLPNTEKLFQRLEKIKK